jgi:hypothetical protein
MVFRAKGKIISEKSIKRSWQQSSFYKNQSYKKIIMAKKNRYIKGAKKAQIIKILKGETNAKGNKGATALFTVKDVLIGVIGGRLVAVTAGGLSLPLGALITAAGHYMGNQNLTALGIGSMAASNQKKSDTISGIDGLDGVKERMKAYKDSLFEDFFINKLLKKKAVNGFGEVQYFNYPDNTVGELAALDSIENQLIDSGLQFQGAEDYVEGIEGVEDYVNGIDDPLY